MAQLLTFDAAQKWLASRVNRPTVQSAAQIALDPAFGPKARMHAFFSARVTQANVLDALKSELADYASGKTDLASARARLKTFLSRQGVAPDDVAVADQPPAGMDEETWQARKLVTHLASTRRLNLILEQNARMANAIGNREVSMNPIIQERWPYFRYIAAMNAPTAPRASHAALHNLVLPKTHPFWLTHTPPWEFGCRCQLEDADEEDVAKYGLGNAVVHYQAEDADSASVRTGSGQGFEVTPPASGFVFRPDEFEKPDWSAIADPEFRAKAQAEWQLAFGKAA